MIKCTLLLLIFENQHVSWHFDIKYPLGYLHRKRYFSSESTSLYGGFENRIKLSSEEIMEKELHSRSEYMKVELILFGMVHLRFTTLHIFTYVQKKRRSPFIVSPAHG